MNYKEIYNLINKGVDIKTIKEFTCNTCTIKDNCIYAYDLYNLDGDCLLEK